MTAAPVTIAGAAALRARIGGEPFVSDWVEIDQPRVDRFADATGDHQWIHVDPARARRESPFGGPVAHGFLTLSLVASLLAQTVHIEQRMGVNYGLNRVRFPAPVPVGARVRASFAIAEVDDVADGALQITWDVTVEIEGGSKPACVAQFVTRHYF
ncbi:MaoC family dehydratase [Trinickia diaoshuihuensis]|uniref:MaoC family dehydratase n=1 Tax=Trinickia diaoshuihuensis TaxID=2292265 RepID=UPI000E22BA5F|nr:MaoC family dehydratase [Trinickia diaoshuihuensis]